MNDTKTYQNPQNSKELLERWLKRLRESQFTHYESAKTLSKYNYVIGIPAIILSTFVGTSLFASIGKTLDPTLQVIVGITSVMAAALGTLQTFLGFSDQAAKHRAIASRYSAARRKIEEMLAVKKETIPPKEISELRKEIDSISDEAPNISDRVWKRVQKKLME